MKIKTLFLFMALVVLSIISQPLHAGRNGQEQPGQVENKTEKKENALDIDYGVGLNLCYNRIPVLLGDDESKNTLEVYYLALQVDVQLLDFLTVGVVAGLNSNNLADQVSILDLPLSLRLEGEKFNTMMFGLRGKADLFSWKYFTFAPTAEILFFKQFKKEIPIELSIASGTAELKNSFTQMRLELLVQYDGLDDFSIIAGPSLNLVSGTLKVSEVIESLTGEKDLSYNQQKSLGLTAGIFYEWGDHFDVYAQISLFSHTSISISIFYVF